MNTRAVGNIGENIAVKYLLSNEYTITNRNWYCYAGEIDIVANHKKRGLVLFEVKFSQIYNKISPEEMFTNRKKQKLYRTISIFLNNNKISDYKIDLICIYKINKGFGVRHYRDIYLLNC